MQVKPAIQTSFNSGEWAPALNARVDLQKYHSGAALLRNFFVDYRGGATARGGTRYILQCRSSAGAVRLIPFQASFTVSYILEFGNNYIRFFNNGAPVQEPAKAITGITKANPAVVTEVGHGYVTNDWVFIQAVNGMTQVNGNYYIITFIDADHYSLFDLNGTAINSTAYSVYTSGGAGSRVYTLASPYTSAELAQIKFAQNVNVLILCHPNYPPYQLTLVSATNWTLAAITFGSTIAAPAGQAVTTTLGAGTANYAYIITAVDSNGQESPPSAYAALANVLDLRTVVGTNTVTWTTVTGAVSYNIYKAEIRITNPVPAGASFGFAGNCTALTFIDSNIAPDYSSGPPVVLNPFLGAGVTTVTINNPGSYNGTVPTVTFAAGAGLTATGYANLHALTCAVNSAGSGYANGDTITSAHGTILQVTSIGGFGTIATISIINAGNISSGAISANPVGIISTSGVGVGANFNFTWGIASISVTFPGTGYGGAPAITISGGGGGVATAVLGAPSSGNPTVPQFFQQRLALLGPVSSPQQFNMSQPGSSYNFNVNNPLEADDAIQGTLVSGQLNTIQSAIAQPQGLIVLTDKQAWLLNGGSAGSAVSAISTVANPQAYNGASYPPPIVANDNILYVQSKTSIVRDLVFNFYTQVYTGSDISVLSSHLFYGYQILEWAWAEEPFKLVWAVRNDGTMLTLTFLKEQELIAWAHSDTQGAFKSVASVTEQVALGSVDAVYTVVQRTVSNRSVLYIERVTELYYPNGVVDAFCVDAGISYNGSATATFSGAQHLAGLTVTGLADGVVIAPFVMPANGTFILGAAASKVVVGLAYTPALQTLELDLGEPTVQGRNKKITAVTLKVDKALGLWIGGDSTTTVPMKDLVRGNIGSATNQVVTDLVTADVRTLINPNWTIQGQYYITQPYPLPASILGVIPEINRGEKPK